MAAKPGGQFLIDSGADLSILPLSFSTPDVKTTNTKLIMADGREMYSTGTRELNFDLLSLNKTFNWKFIVADVKIPILGLDFLTKHNFVIDCGNQTIVHYPKANKSQCSYNHLSNVENAHLNMITLPKPNNTRHGNMLVPSNIWQKSLQMPKTMHLSKTNQIQQPPNQSKK